MLFKPERLNLARLIGVTVFVVLTVCFSCFRCFFHLFRQVAVASYGGYASDDTILQNAARLRAALIAKGAEADFSVFYAAGYDSPFRFFNRHNEIWFPLSNADSAC